MKSILAFILFCNSFIIFSQTKREKINLSSQDQTKTTRYTDGKTTTTRKIDYIFSVGDGPMLRIGKKGKNLGAALKSDKAAYEEFKNYQNIVKKVNRNNLLRVGGYVFFIGGVAMVLALGDIRSEEKNVPVIASGAAIAVGGLVAAGVGGKKIDKLMDEATLHLQRSVSIYNGNIK